MNRRHGASFALILLSAWSSPASAAIVTYTFSGTVSSQFGSKGIFGGIDYTGKSFTDVQTFDLSKGFYVMSADGSNTTAFGGTVSGYPTIGTSVLTVDTLPISISFPGTYSSSFGSQKAYGVNTSVVVTNTGTGVEDQQFSILSSGITDGISPLTLTGPNLGNGDYENSVGGVYAFLNLAVTKLEITTDASVVSPVPLPASLPLFGGALLTLAAFGYGATRGSQRDKTQPAI